MISDLNLSSDPMQTTGLGTAVSNNPGYLRPALFDVRRQTSINSAVSYSRVLLADVNRVRGPQNVHLWAEGGASGARTCKLGADEILAQCIIMPILTARVFGLGQSVFVPKNGIAGIALDDVAPAKRSLSGSRGSPPPDLR